MLDLPQNLAHDTITKTPQSLILRSRMSPFCGHLLEPAN